MSHRHPRAIVVFVLLACAAGSAAAGGYERPPLCRWTFDDGTAADASGNGHAGRITGSPGVSIVDGRKALRFDGKTTRVTIPDHPSLHLRKSLTIAARLMPFRTDKLHTILNKWYALDAYMLLIENGHYVFSVAFPGGRWGRSVNARAGARCAEWAEVVGTFDGSELRLYVDGKLAATRVARGGLLQDSDRPLVIGHHPGWNAFTGLIDEVRLYDHAVPPEAVGTLFGEAGSAPRAKGPRSSGPTAEKEGPGTAAALEAPADAAGEERSPTPPAVPAPAPAAESQKSWFGR